MKLVKPIDPLANFLLLVRQRGISLTISNAAGRPQGQRVFNTRPNVKHVLCHQDADGNFPDECGQDQVPVIAVPGSFLPALLQLVSSLTQHPCPVCPNLCISSTALCCAPLPKPVCMAEPGRSCFCLLFYPFSLRRGGRWHQGPVPVQDPPVALRSAGLSCGWAVPMPTVAWVMVLAVFQLAGAGTSLSPNGQQRCGSKPPEVGLGPCDGRLGLGRMAPCRLSSALCYV